MTNKCVKELVGFINAFHTYPYMFRQVFAILAILQQYYKMLGPAIKEKEA
jgi:hypothetical protein